METITKEKIANELQASIGLSYSICEELVTQIFKSSLDIIAQERGLKIKNFGSFALSQKKARPGMNLQTNQPIIIEPRVVVKFTPSRNLKKRLNNE